MDLDVETRERLGYLTTRLYLSLYVTGMIVLIFYTSFVARTVSKTSHHPTLATAARLQEKYFGLIECPCTRAYIPYEEIVTIDVDFHQVS